MGEVDWRQKLRTTLELNAIEDGKEHVCTMMMMKKENVFGNMPMLRIHIVTILNFYMEESGTRFCSNSIKINTSLGQKDSKKRAMQQIENIQKNLLKL